jgi:hypothetical protein
MTSPEDVEMKGTGKIFLVTLLVLFSTTNGNTFEFASVSNETTSSGDVTSTGADDGAASSTSFSVGFAPKNRADSDPLVGTSKNQLQMKPEATCNMNYGTPEPKACLDNEF